MTRAEALAIARACTLEHMWRFQQLYQAGEVHIDEDGNLPGEQLRMVEDASEKTVKHLEAMIAEEKATVTA